MLKGRGSAPNIVCPLHRWTYDLKGELLGAPQFREQPVPRTSRARRCSTGTACCSTARATSRTTSPALGASTFDFSGYVLDRVETARVRLQLEVVHRGLPRGLPRRPVPSRARPVRHLRRPEVGVRADWASVQTRRHQQQAREARARKPTRGGTRRCCDFYDGEIPPHGAIWLTYYPNIMLEWYPHVLVVSTLVPEASDRTLNVVEFYYPEEIALFEREFVEAEQAAYMETAAEDDEIAERMDAGRKRALRAGPQRSRAVPVADGGRHAALPRVLPARDGSAYRAFVGAFAGWPGRLWSRARRIARCFVPSSRPTSSNPPSRAGPRRLRRPPRPRETRRVGQGAVRRRTHSRRACSCTSTATCPRRRPAATDVIRCPRPRSRPRRSVGSASTRASRSSPTTRAAACSRRACGGCCAGSASRPSRCSTAVTPSGWAKVASSAPTR